MLATLLLGIAAGAGAPYAERHVKGALEGVLLADAAMSGTELRLFSFAVCLVGASILAHLIGSGSAFALAVGAAIGVFGPRFLDRIQKRRDPDYGPDPYEE